MLTADDTGQPAQCAWTSSTSLCCARLSSAPNPPHSSFGWLQRATHTQQATQTQQAGCSRVSCSLEPQLSLCVCRRQAIAGLPMAGPWTSATYVWQKMTKAWRSRA